jgi:hypothetical protein
MRKNAPFARYLGAILCNLKQKKMYSSEFCSVLGTLYRNEKSLQKKFDFSLCWYEICVGGAEKRVSGYQGIRVSGYQGIRVSGYQGIRESEN